MIRDGTSQEKMNKDPWDPDDVIHQDVYVTELFQFFVRLFQLPR